MEDKIYKFKSDTKIFYYSNQLSLERKSKKCPVLNLRKFSLKEMYTTFQSINAINKSQTLNFHKSLLINNNIT